MPQDRGTAPIDLPRAVGTLLGLPAEDVDEHANLIELGLDSLRMMRLAGQWRRAGLDIGFAGLAAEPTLAAWRKLTDRPHGDAAGPTPDPAQAVDVDESEPFELALMQHAYWVGRADGQQLGGVAAHFYHEFDGTDVDPARLEAAVRALFAHHGMLRARILDDGRQRIAPESTWPGLRVHDLRALDAADAERRLAELRRCLSHRSMDIAAGEVGELLVRGPYTLRGYYRAEEHNRTTFTPDGFYRSGDLVRQLPSGHLVVEGRIKDVINLGGEKVPVEEVENLLPSHPAVHDVAIVGIPDEALGERSCACVIAHGPPPTRAGLNSHLTRRGLAAFKLPDEVRMLASFPRTTLGKVNKRALAEQIAGSVAR